MDDYTLSLLKWIDTALVVLGLILLFAGLAAYHIMTPSAKKRWWPLEAGVVAVWFVFFLTTSSLLHARSWSALNNLFVIVPIVILAWGVNVMSTTFCDQCGALQIYNTLLTPRQFCFRCGARIDPPQPPDDAPKDTN